MNENILLVDRDPDTLKALDTLLKNKGHQTWTASRCREALDLIKSHPFHLVITDIRIPDVNGLEFIKQIKELDQELEVIVITGFVSIDNAVRALRDGGALDFIAKPLKTFDELMVAVDRALHKRRHRQEKRARYQRLEKANMELESRIHELISDLPNQQQK